MSSGPPTASQATHGSEYDDQGFLIRHHEPEAPPERARKSIERRELASLLGLSLDDARQRLKEIGHTGSVRVTRLVDEDRKCAQDAVCMVQPWGGLIETAEVTLYLNGTFKIAPPPP